ncbi:DMT family transporter [Streptomyces sp. FIT100]|uniref:DMT family transporter n=1 Tax=Streptomyces sp. FIT100 TaxID=2837956 RepID=UPI0021C6C805|nr:DMT family transporter [Streptomyces sp. FIT100]UUN30489.1 DMT family transporter [Streptomyces sp. FIT100]
MSSLALSVLLSLVSAVAYAAAAIVQERVAVGASGGPSSLLRDVRWWVAVGLSGVGGLLHVVALAYGPLSLVQPLGALTIVFALPMAALFARGAVRAGPGAGRVADPAAWRGALSATAGLAGLLALTGPAADSRPPDADVRTVLAAVAFGAIAVLFLLARRVRRPVLRGVVLAAGSGVAFGVASVFTKIAAEALEVLPGRGTSGLLPAVLVTAGLAVTGLLMSQASYRGAGLAAPLATVTVVNPVVAAAVGIGLFDERFRFGTAGTALALVCGAVAAAGLVLLTTRRQPVPVPATVLVSDRDATRPEVGERIDVGAVPRARAHLEVEVRPGAVAGGS